MSSTHSPSVMPALRRLISLKPYGTNLLTPAAATWILIARILIFLMAASEAVSWGYLGSFFLAGWYAIISAAFTAAIIFFVVWGADVNLMTLDRARPFYEKRLYDRTSDNRWTEKAKVLSAFASRWFIVIVSLLITAPFLSQIVFSADIKKELERETKAQVESARKTIEDQYTAPISKFEKSIANLQNQHTDETAGKPNSRTGKYGNGPVAKSIKDRIDYEEAELQKLVVKRDGELESFDIAVSGEKYDELGNRWGVVLPTNSVIKRGELLEKLMKVPTYTKTEWAIRAFLGFLFLSLFILKMFEPRSIKIYLSEALQQEWQRYRTGAFDTWVAYHEKSNAPHCTMTSYRFEDLMINSYPAIRREDLARRESESVEREAKEGLEALREIEDDMQGILSHIVRVQQGLSGVESEISEVITGQGAFPTRHAQQEDEISRLEQKLQQIGLSLQSKRSGTGNVEVEMLQLLEEQVKAVIQTKAEIEVARKELDRLEQEKAIYDTKLIPLYDKRKQFVAQITDLQAKVQTLEAGKDEIRNRRIASAVKRGVGKTA